MVICSVCGNRTGNHYQERKKIYCRDCWERKIRLYIIDRNDREKVLEKLDKQGRF